MRKKKGYIPGCLGALWALISLACGGGALTSSGPTVNRHALEPTDVILVHAQSGETSSPVVYAVKRGETKPMLWPSTATDDMTAVTAVSHVYMGNRQFPYDDKTPFYYGANGLHVAIPQPDYVPLPDRLRPPEPENNRLEVVTLHQSPDGRYLAYTVREKYDRNRPHSTVPRQLFLLDGETGEIQLLREDGLMAKAVEWSADGRYLAFQSAHAGVASIHMADLPQQTVAELYKLSTSTHAASGFAMSWSPDSRQIAFLGLGKCATAIDGDVLVTGSRTYCHRDVYILPINGGGAQRVTNTDDGPMMIEPGYTIGWLKTDQKDG